MSREIYIFADWDAFDEPSFAGTLGTDVVKVKEHFSFAYDKAWLQSKSVQQRVSNFCACKKCHSEAG